MRSHFLIERYLPDETRVQRHNVTGITRNWELVAEFEAILRYLCNFAMTVQKDIKVSIGQSWINVLLLKESVKVPTYDIIDLDAEKGDGGPDFDELPVKRLKWRS